MLYYLKIQRADQIQNLLKQYPLKTTTWIVSDLKSKQDLQKMCLEQHGFFTDENILRVSDFWVLWLRRLAPQISVVSSDFVDLVIKKVIQECTDELDLQAHQAPTLARYVRELAPALLAFQGPELNEWFIEKKYNSEDHEWYKWYLASRFTLQKILSLNILEAAWVAPYLQREDISVAQWSRPLILDLGSEMTSVEMGLFQNFSRQQDVYVIVPQPLWQNQFQFLLNTYSFHEGYARLVKIESSFPKIENATRETSPAQKTFLRFSTELTEVQWIVAQVRRWLEAGVLPERIALCSVRTEHYWPLLSIYCEFEGLPVEKNKVASLLSLGFFQNVLALAQTRSHLASWESLEVSYTLNEKIYASKNFEKFKALFYEMTEPEDLHRDELIHSVFFRKIPSGQDLTRMEFLALVFKMAMEVMDDPAEDEALLEAIIKDFMSQSVDIKASFAGWLDLLKARLAKKEQTLSHGEEKGIAIRSFGAVSLQHFTHRIWYGLDESSFRSTKKNLLPLSDIESLKRTFDFPISYPEESHEEFHLRWLSDSDCTEQFFTCAHVSVQAEPLTTSHFILENNPDPEALQFYGQAFTSTIMNRLLEMQMADASPLHKNSAIDYTPEILSGTEVAQYADCPFKILAGKGFRLREESIVSVDLDPVQKGTLAHALFEYLVQNKRYLNIEAKDIEAFLEEQRQKRDLFPAEELFWNIQKKKFVNIGLSFSKKEKERLLHCSVQHITEKPFTLKYTDFQITGRIDRIDQAELTSEKIIYDYKRAPSDSTHYAKNWLENNELQLLFYLKALIAEEEDPQKVRGALYYFYQKLEVYKGALLEGSDHLETMIETKKNTLISNDDFQTLMTTFDHKISELLQRLKKSDFSTQPRNYDICERCQWSTLCRAPHLH